MFLEPRMLEACLGDLEEKFQCNIRNDVPRWKASTLYILEGLGFVKMARTTNSASTQTTINLINHTLLFLTRLVKRDKSYYIVSQFDLFEYAKEAPFFGRLSSSFEACIYGLNMVRSELDRLKAIAPTIM